MEKLIRPIVDTISGFLPGMKTYICWMCALLMLACQALGHYTFELEAWAAVGITGMGTWKMEMDRK